ncbi:MAG: response regulator [Planctomycetes bacterium]|nr:response regulator [Planctomycetota bacterium]
MTRVLVADDNPDCRELLRLILEGAYEILEAADGLVALELAQRLRPHLAIVDVHLPKIDGVDLARRLRALGCVDLVMAFTGSTELESAALGAFDSFLLKPARPAEIRRAVDDLVAAPRAS